MNSVKKWVDPPIILAIPKDEARAREYTVRVRGASAGPRAARVRRVRGVHAWRAAPARVGGARCVRAAVTDRARRAGRWMRVRHTRARSAAAAAAARDARAQAGARRATRTAPRALSRDDDHVIVIQPAIRVIAVVAW